MSNSKKITWFKVMFCFTYFTNYITRVVFSSSIVAITDELKMDSSTVGLALTALFIATGVGQIIGGMLGDRFSARKLIYWSLFADALFMLIMPLYVNLTYFIVINTLSGFSHAIFWPCIVKIATDKLNHKDYSQSMLFMTYTAAIGAMATYGCAALSVLISDWKLCFYAFGVITAISAVIWDIATKENGFANPDAPDDNSFRITLKPTADGKVSVTALVGTGIVTIMLGVFLQGMLRDGVSTWIPKYVKDAFSSGNAAAILTGVILPPFSMLSAFLASRVRKKTKSELTTAGIFFCIGLFCALLVYPFLKVSAVVAVALMAIVSGCMHGVNLMLVTEIPAYYKRLGNVSKVTGFINCCTYIGGAASTYGFALVCEKGGWGATVLIWAVTALLGAICCFATLGQWRKFIGKTK